MVESAVAFGFGAANEDSHEIRHGDFDFRHGRRCDNRCGFLCEEGRGQHEESQQKNGHVTHRGHVDERALSFDFRLSHITSVND